MFQNESHSTEEWADILHLSSTTLQKYLKILHKQLLYFNLALSLNPVKIEGDEMDIRNFFFSFFYESDITPHTILPTAAIQHSVNEIGQLFDKEAYHYSSFTLTSYLLMISLERYNGGNVVKVSDSLYIAVQYSVQLMHFQKINYIIEKHFGFTLPKEEILHLFICIVTQRKIKSVLVEQKFCLSYNHWSEIGVLTKDFYQNFFSMQPTQEKKSDHILIESFFTTAKLKDCLTFSANRNIEDVNQFVTRFFFEEYCAYYNFFETNAQYLALYSKQYLTDFCVNLVIHIEAIREAYWGKKKNIGFIFEGNRSVCQFIENLAKKYFSPYQAVFFPDSSEVNADYLEMNDIDILVTNYSEYINEFNEFTECVLFRSIPTANDWNRLLTRINPKITNQYLLADR